MVEYTPLSDDQIQTKARELTTKAEQSQNVAKELNNMPFDERARVAHAMQAINDQDRSENKSIPKLEFTFQKDSGGQEHLTDMTSVKDPSAWVFKGKTDIYDLPPACQSAFLFFDQAKLTADINDSEVIKNPDIYTSAYRK